MTFQRAVAIFPRPWIDGDVTLPEWLLACSVIQDAIEAANPDGNHRRKSPTEQKMSTRHRITNAATPVLPQAIREAIEKEAIALDRLYGRIPPGSRMSDCVEAFERIATLACSIAKAEGQ